MRIYKDNNMEKNNMSDTCMDYMYHFNEQQSLNYKLVDSKEDCVKIESLIKKR